MTTYRVTLPDGTIATRKSNRAYTHAVAVYATSWKDPNGPRRWGMLAFCGSLKLADKRAAERRRHVPGDTTQILEVQTA